MKKYLLIIIAFFSFHGSFAQWNTDRILNIGRNAYFYEDYVLSIQYFNQIIKIKPYLAEPYMFRAMAKISLGDYIGAEQDCDTSIEINPFVPYAYYIRGFAKKNLMKFDEAIYDFTKALEFDPDNSHYLANRIEAKERNKDYQGAIKDLEYFQKTNPKAKGIEYEIGRIMLAENDTIGAIQKIKLSIEKDSTMEMPYKLLAYIAESKDDLDEAINQLNKLKKINPKSENLNVELAKLYINKSDTASAKEELELAIKNSPRNPYAYSAKAFLLMQQKRENEAIEFYNKAIEFGSEFAGDYINRGVLNVKKYNFTQALNDYNYAILLDRNSSLAYYNRALLRNNLGDKNNALSDLNRVIELDPKNHEALLQQSYLLLELGYLDEAITNFEAILEAYPYFAPAYYSLAEANEKKGDFKKANQYKSLVFELVNNRDYYKIKQDLVAENKTVNIPAPSVQESTIDNLSDKLSAQGSDKSTKNDYENKLRGKVQNSYTELEYLNYANCSFESVDSVLSSTNHYHNIVEQFNKSKSINKTLSIRIVEDNLKADNIQKHFNHIDILSKKIESKPDVELLIARAIEFDAVHDYDSALDDINRAIEMDNKNALAYFTRANVLVHLLENEQLSGTESSTVATEKEQLNTDVNRMKSLMIINDYNKAIELQANFTFAHYNKANYLAKLKEYKQAIASYSEAIEYDSNFAEAYYGRALSYIFLNNENAAKLDLSKSGELGVYKAYNLLNRLLKTE